MTTPTTRLSAEAMRRIECDCNETLPPFKAPLVGLFRQHCQDLLADREVLEAERDDFLNRSHQTVLFPCGCLFKQEGLDAEPLLVVHCNSDKVAALEAELQEAREQRDWLQVMLESGDQFQAGRTQLRSELVTAVRAKRGRYLNKTVLIKLIESFEVRGKVEVGDGE